MASIFISYSHVDIKSAEMLASALETFGHRIWWDDRLRAGEPFRERIEKSLSNVDAVMVIWTAASINSDWVRAEAKVAKDRDVMVPVRFDKAISPPGELSDVHIEYFGDWNAAASAPEIQRLNERIAHLKSASDLEKVAEMVPLALRQTIRDSNSLKVLLDSAFPGGLRVYRFLLGAVVTSGAIWIMVKAIHGLAGDEEEIALAELLAILIKVGTARICNQIILASRNEFVDRFFDPSFAFFSLTSLLLGTLFSISTLFFYPHSLIYTIDQAVYLFLVILVALYALRLSLFAISLLQRRVR